MGAGSLSGKSDYTTRPVLCIARAPDVAAMMAPAEVARDLNCLRLPSASGIRSMG